MRAGDVPGARNVIGKGSTFCCSPDGEALDDGCLLVTVTPGEDADRGLGTRRDSDPRMLRVADYRGHIKREGGSSVRRNRPGGIFLSSGLSETPTKTLAVAVIDDAGQLLAAQEVPNTEQSFIQLVGLFETQ